MKLLRESILVAAIVAIVAAVNRWIFASSKHPRVFWIGIFFLYMALGYGADYIFGKKQLTTVEPRQKVPRFSLRIRLLALLTFIFVGTAVGWLWFSTAIKQADVYDELPFVLEELLLVLSVLLMIKLLRGLTKHLIPMDHLDDIGKELRRDLAYLVLLWRERHSNLEFVSNILSLLKFPVMQIWREWHSNLEFVSIVAISICWILFGVSLCYPVFHLKDGTNYYGWILLLFGWLGIFSANGALCSWGWWANPFFVIGTMLMCSFKYRATFVTGVLALSLAITSFLLRDIEAGDLHGPSHKEDIVGYGAGFFLWLSAMVLFFAASTILFYRSCRVRPKVDMS